MWTDHPSVPASAFMTVRCVQPLCKQLSFGVSITPKCLGYSVKLHGPKKKSTATSGSGDWTLMTCQEPGLGCLQGKLRGQCQVPGSFMQQFNRPMACWLLTFNAVGFGGVLWGQILFVSFCVKTYGEEMRKCKHPFDVHRYRLSYIHALADLDDRSICCFTEKLHRLLAENVAPFERNVFILASFSYTAYCTELQGKSICMKCWNAWNANFLNGAETQGCWRRL